MPFCKNDNGTFLIAPNRVIGPGFTLRKNIPADRSRIEDGWQWFDTAAEGRAAYGLPTIRAEVRAEFLAEPETQAEIERRIAERREDG